jgi:hypothetical protein
VQVQLSSGLPVPPDGAEQNYSASNQSAYLKFVAAANDNLELSLSELTSQDVFYNTLLVSVYGPTGVNVGGGQCYLLDPSRGCSFHLWNLEAGTYTVIASPYTGTGTVAFKARVTRDRVAMITPDNPINLTLQTGQVQRFTFNATAGDTIGLQLANIATNPANVGVRMLLYRPDVGPITTSTAAYVNIASSTSAVTNLANLPVSGTYTLVVTPDSGVAATVQVQLSSGLPVPPDGAEQNYSASNQSAYLKFVAAANDNLELSLSELTGQGVFYNTLVVSVYGPTGGNVGGGQCYVLDTRNSCSFHLWNLEAGTYTVIASPYSGAGTVAFKARVTRNVIYPDMVKNESVSMNLDLSQVARRRFSAHAGDNVTLYAWGIETDPIGDSVTFLVYRPDTSTITPNNAYFTFSSNVLLQAPAGYSSSPTLANLPVSGTYTVVMVPNYGVSAHIWFMPFSYD